MMNENTGTKLFLLTENGTMGLKSYNILFWGVNYYQIIKI